MPHALRAPAVQPGLSEIAEEFKRLDQKRRAGGLSLGEAGHYHALFSRLSDELASGQRHRKVDTRQFLRVPVRLTIDLRRGRGVVHAECHEFGGGGCAIACHERLDLDDDVWLDGADLEGERHELRGRATVVWTRLAAAGAPTIYGVRFRCDVPAERDQIDRLFYRVLDRFLNAGR